MKHNPKVVNFNDSASYAYHRAMKNLKSRNWLDALELLRSAAEKSPENADYKLQLIREYSGAGYYPQAVRMALDLLAEGHESEALYRMLAFNLLHLGNANILCTYLEYAIPRVKDDLFRRVFRSLLFSSCAPMPPITLKDVDEERTYCLTQRAKKYLDEGKFERAFELCESLPPSRTDQSPILLCAAEAARMLDRRKEALQRLDFVIGLDGRPETRLRAADLLQTMGETKKAKALLKKIQIASLDTAQAVRVLRALYGFALYDECAEGALLALQKKPYDRELLHLRAVALYACGESEQNVGKYWLRILRIDPEDCVARYYYNVCESGALKKNRPDSNYRLPRKEYLRRVKKIQSAAMTKNFSPSRAWLEDAEFHEIILWATQSDEENLWEAAVTVLCGCDDPLAVSLMRQLPVVHPFSDDAFFAACGRRTGFAGKLRDFYISLLQRKDPKAVRSGYSVSELKLCQSVCQYLAAHHNLYDPLSPIEIWRLYRDAPQSCDDLSDSMEAATGAVAYCCLKGRGLQPDIDEIHDHFGGSKRKLEHYIRRIERACNAAKGALEDENY